MHMPETDGYEYFQYYNIRQSRTMARTKAVARRSTGPSLAGARAENKALKEKTVSHPANAGVQDQSEVSSSNSSLANADQLIITKLNDDTPPNTPLATPKAKEGAIENSSWEDLFSLKHKADANTIGTEPSAKRVRVDSQTAQPSFQKHKKHWDVDIDPLVSIEIAGVGFRLRRSRLTSQSDFFNRMFSIELPVVMNGVTVKRAVWENSPLYVMSSEKLRAKDFETLLDVLDDVT